jgi:chemosensory pili system protein ChpA (sensor histidine kinase/response regulator)
MNLNPPEIPSPAQSAAITQQTEDAAAITGGGSSQQIPAAQESALVVTATPDLETMKRADVAPIFSEFETAAKPLLEKAGQLVITPDNRLVIADIAAGYRKQIKAVRTACERKRKEMVEGIKRQAKQIDTAAGVIWDLCEKAEANLLAIEEHAERQEAERLNNLVAARSKELEAIEANPAHYGLRTMTDAEFAEILDGLKLAHQAKLDRAAKEAERKKLHEARGAVLIGYGEEPGLYDLDMDFDRFSGIVAKLEEEKIERAERAKKDAEEREAQRLENERLKAEAIERENQRQRELEAAEAERRQIAEEAAAREAEITKARIAEHAEAERQRRELQAANDAKLKEIADAAEKQRQADEAHQKRLADQIAAFEAQKLAEKQEREEAERIAAAAPDVDKFLAWIEKVLHTEFPEVKSPEIDALQAELNGKLHALLRGFEARVKCLSKPKKATKLEGELL